MTSHIQRAIGIAAKNGWRNITRINLVTRFELSYSIGGESYCTSPQETFLDPNFWIALGKGLGWCEGKESAPDGLCSDCSFPNCANNWKSTWHAFIDSLIAGESAESFFQSLLKDVKEIK